MPIATLTFFFVPSESLMNIARVLWKPSTRTPILTAVMLLLLGLPERLAAEANPAPESEQSARASKNSGASPGESGDAIHAQGKRGTRPSSRRRSGTRPAPTRRAKREVTVPVELSVGPAFFVFANPISGGEVLSGPLTEGQTFHYGLRIDIAAIITHEFVQKNPRLVPRKYHSMFKPGSELRFTPGILGLIPRDIIISPKFNHTGAYGANWELMGIGLDLLGSPTANLNLNAGLLATYVYIDSDLTDTTTHFLRPGLSVGLSAGTMLGDSFGVRIGWNSNFYIPQAIGGGVFEMGEGERSLWHIGEAFLQFRFRFPYTTTL